MCACRDFTAEGCRLFDFCSIKNTVLESESGGNGTELADIIDTIEKQQYVQPEELLKHFWDVFVVDALLGNFDRHNGNWGFLFDDSTGRAEPAPEYSVRIMQLFRTFSAGHPEIRCSDSGCQCSPL